MKPYEISKTCSIIIEKSSTSESFTIKAIKGTIFYGEYRHLDGSRAFGELLLEGDFCIPMVPDGLFIEVK
jgi:hypothetical protein